MCGFQPWTNECDGIGGFYNLRPHWRLDRCQACRGFLFLDPLYNTAILHEGQSKTSGSRDLIECSEHHQIVVKANHMGIVLGRFHFMFFADPISVRYLHARPAASTDLNIR